MLPSPPNTAPHSVPSLGIDFRIERMNEGQLRGQNDVLLREIHNRDCKLRKKQREIQRLRSIIAEKDASILRPARADVSSCGSHIRSNPHSTDSRIRKLDEHIRAIQTLSEDDKKETESLQKTCEEQTKKIEELEVGINRLVCEKVNLQRTCLELDKTIEGLEAKINLLEHQNETKSSLLDNSPTDKTLLVQRYHQLNEDFEKQQAEKSVLAHQNNAQSSRLERCLEANSSLSQRYQQLNKRCEELQTENASIAGLKKRILAICLSTSGFSKDDFTAETEPLGSQSLPKDNLNMVDAEPGLVSSPTKHLDAVPEVLQPEDFSMNIGRGAEDGAEDIAKDGAEDVAEDVSGDDESNDENVELNNRNNYFDDADSDTIVVRGPVSSVQVYDNDDDESEYEPDSDSDVQMDPERDTSFT